MPTSPPADRHATVAFAAVAVVAVLMLPIVADAATYRVRLHSDDLSQATPLHRSNSFPIGASNGTATFTGDGFAYPGHVGQYNRVDMTWSSGLSGGAAAEILCDSRATDFVVSGPPGPAVPATLHFRARGGTSRLGGFTNNGGHGTQAYVRTEMNGALATGYFRSSNGGGTPDGVFTGQTGDAFDVAFTLSQNVPVNSPFIVDIQIDVTNYCYGNVFNTNPGYVLSDVGNASSPPVAGDGLQLEEVGGVVMTLPAGYTLNSTSWGIVDNHFTSSVAVDPAIGGRDFAVAVAPNPAIGAQRIALTLPRAGEVHAAVFDAAGRRVRALADRRFEAGTTDLAWDGRGEHGGHVGAGVYFVRISAAERVLTRRIVRLE